MLAECPGWSPGVGALGARSTRRAPGRGSRGTVTRDTWRAREHPGILPAGVLGDRCLARRTPGYGLRVGHSGTGVAFGGSVGKYHSLGSRRARGLPGGLVANG